jgi:hypothetical protein
MAPQLFSHNKQLKLKFSNRKKISSKPDPERLARRHDETKIESEIIKPDKGVTGPPDLVDSKPKSTKLVEPQAQAHQTATLRAHNYQSTLTAPEPANNTKSPTAPNHRKHSSRTSRQLPQIAGTTGSNGIS